MSMYDYEKGRQKCPIEVVVKLCRLYKCSIEELLGLEKNEAPLPEKKDKKEVKFLPVFQAGVLSKNYYIVHHSIISDPYIMTELGLNELKLRKSPFDSLTQKLSPAEKRNVVIEILKYLNSLIHVDGRVDPHELEMQQAIFDSLDFELTLEQSKAISRAANSKYIAKGSRKVFPNKALKRFLIWILVLAAYSDGEFLEVEEMYIKEVSSNLELTEDDYQFIHKRVREVLLGKNEFKDN